MTVTDAIRATYPDAQIQASISDGDMVSFQVAGDTYRASAGRSGLLVERRSYSGAYWICGAEEREIQRRLEAVRT